MGLGNLRIKNPGVGYVESRYLEFFEHYFGHPFSVLNGIP